MPEKDEFDRRTVERVPRGPIFAERGGPAASPDPGSLTVPTPLSSQRLAEIRESLGSDPEPGDLHARLTPSAPSVPGRGALVFVNANVVEGGAGYAEFEGTWTVPDAEPQPVRGFVFVWVHFPAEHRFLVDCAVGGGSVTWIGGAGPLFSLSGSGASQAFDFRNNYDAEGYHLISALDAHEAGWHSIRISTEKPTEEVNNMQQAFSFSWQFFWCEVTYL